MKQLWVKYLALLVLSATAPWTLSAQPVATGLLAPAKLTLTTAGNLLVGEGGTTTPNNGRVSLVTLGGSRRTLISGLPSAVYLGTPSGPNAVILRGQTLWILIGQGDILVEGTVPGTEVPNPTGLSSPLFSSLLAVRFDSNPESLTAGFSLTIADQFRLADGLDVTLDNGAGSKATVTVIADFRDFIPDPNTIIRASDPYGMAFDASDANILYVADAGQNAILRVDTTTGRVRTIVRFPPLPTGLPGPPVSDAVPTSVHVYGDQLLVTLLTGFPFLPGHSRVMLVNPATGAAQPFIGLLSSAMDTAVRETPDRTQFFTLEFSGNLGADSPPPGRLTQYDSPNGKVLANNLITPSSMALDPATGDIFITEIGPGLIVRAKAQ